MFSWTFSGVLSFQVHVICPRGQRLGRSQHLPLILPRRPLLTPGEWVPTGAATNWISVIESIVEPGSNIPAPSSKKCSEKKGFLGSCLPGTRLCTDCLLNRRGSSSLLLEALSHGKIHPRLSIHSWWVDVPASWDLESEVCKLRWMDWIQLVPYFWVICMLRNDFYFFLNGNYSSKEE